jgi:putative nucleotidyltransferase with HDIG domain
VSAPRVDTGRVAAVRPETMMVSTPPDLPIRDFPAPVHLLRLGIAVLLAIITFLLFPASPAVNFPLLEVGAVATENVIAPFAFDVPKSATELEAERNELARMVTPTLRYSPAALDSSLARLASLRSALAASDTSGTNDAAFVASAARAGLRLTPEEATYLMQSSPREAMLGAVERSFREWVARGVAAPGALDTIRGPVVLQGAGEERTINADSVLSFRGFITRARTIHPDAGSSVADAIYLKILSGYFQPTVTLDAAATEQLRQELRASVDPTKYTVRAGEKIIGAHEVIGREEYEKLRALRDQMQSVSTGLSASLGRAAGGILFNLVLVGILGLSLLMFRPQLYESLRVMLLIALMFVIVLVISRLIASNPETMHVELIPIALAAVTFSILLDARISMIATIVLVVLIGGQNVFRGTNALFLNLIAGVAAAFSVRSVRRRDQAYRSILTIAGAYATGAIAIGLNLGWPFSDIVWSAGWGLVNAFVSVSLAFVLLPSAEEFTGIDTYLKLLEWSDLNRPLLQRLSLEAPGTFAHTIMMANLVEAGANAIGANGLLARVGTYYHDIGKLRKPQYFVENQPKGRNPHDKLKPTTSAQIIRNHVTAGVELAEEHKLPNAVKAFITEHHGTGAITYFYEKARERDGTVPNPQEFQYPGPIPRSAETAICMLADGVEASMRVLNDPTPEKIREVIDHIVRQRMDQGQLKNAPLTLAQIEAVKREFARVLNGMYHNRIDYPATSGGVSAEFVST